MVAPRRVCLMASRMRATIATRCWGEPLGSLKTAPTGGFHRRFFGLAFAAGAAAATATGAAAEADAGAAAGAAAVAAVEAGTTHSAATPATVASIDTDRDRQLITPGV